MTYKRVFELAQSYVPPDPLEQVSINWPAATWLQRRRAELAKQQLEGGEGDGNK